MKGNKLIFSKYKEERVKGYKKLIKAQKDSYAPPKDIVADIAEAMLAQDRKVTKKDVEAYLRASYAAFDRRYYMNNARQFTHGKKFLCFFYRGVSPRYYKAQKEQLVTRGFKSHHPDQIFCSRIYILYMDDFKPTLNFLLADVCIIVLMLVIYESCY